MSNKSIAYISIGLGQIGNGANAVQVGKNVGGAIQENQGNGPRIDAALSALQMVEGFAGSINKSIRPLATKYGPVPWVGAALSAAALVNDASKITTQISEGKVKKSDIYAAISDACALLGQGMLVLAGLATLAAPAALLLLATPCCCRSRSSGSQHWPERGLGICRRGHCRGYARGGQHAECSRRHDEQARCQRGGRRAETRGRLGTARSPAASGGGPDYRCAACINRAVYEDMGRNNIGYDDHRIADSAGQALDQTKILGRVCKSTAINPLPDILKAIWCLSGDLYAAK
ncbi:hypothetical protein QS306_03585 [Paraburkholderia bonniea]|uniref:hypothetical protein n=1 Tax=Paraburkholderia bonniea TaxID=2152891 RepID=UPI002572D6E1|nr:hypothetical protein [Paraburkholderia bonniea]WJF90758.1 hypothetical protein QS306_03585 [Paraburkholderia bonniea]WJF94072.1 hypothetical protein QS308_03585 [Paraburkholderia bonniea]